MCARDRQLADESIVIELRHPVLIVGHLRLGSKTHKEGKNNK